jgi:hypothetical protein
MVQEKPCRHEYIKIFQRRLKGLDRRMVSTRGYLPVGFKATDFGHLGEGSYCFCATCRARLYPRRTQAEKAAARVALAQSKSAAQAALDELQMNDLQLETAIPDSDLSDLALELAGVGSGAGEGGAPDASRNIAAEVHVEELDYVAVDMEDIEADGVKLSDDEEESSGDEGEL